MTDLFGQEIVPVSKQSKKAASTKKLVIAVREVTKEEMESRGLNSIWREFGEWIVNNRGNKL